MEMTSTVSSTYILDDDGVYAIVKPFAERVGSMLKVGMVDSLHFESTAPTMDSHGHPLMASEYKGHFLISLKEEIKGEGFLGKLERTGLSLNDVHTQLVDLQMEVMESSRKEKENAKKEKTTKVQDLGTLQVANETLTKQVSTLNTETQHLKEQVSFLTTENRHLKKRVTTVEEHLKAVQGHLEAVQEHLKKNDRVATNVRLRIALEAAHNQLTSDLERAPEMGSGWKDFIDSITPEERERLTVLNVSSRMLDLMAKGKRKLNSSAHEALRLDVALAVTSARENHEAWLEVFKYAYKDDPEEMVFDSTDEAFI